MGELPLSQGIPPVGKRSSWQAAHGSSPFTWLVEVSFLSCEKFENPGEPHVCSYMTTATKASLACISVAIEGAKPDLVFLLLFLLLSYSWVDISHLLALIRVTFLATHRSLF